METKEVSPEVWESVKAEAVKDCRKHLKYAEDAGIDASYTRALRLLIEKIKGLQ